MKKINSFLTVFILLSCIQLTFGQILPIWTTSYSENYPLTIYQNDMTIDNDGNVYVIGYTNDTASNITGIALKYNTYGQLEWTQFIDSIHYFSKIAVDDSSNVYISGKNNNGFNTLKFNTNGNFIWSKIYSTGSWIWDLITDDSSNVYITGLSNGNRFTTIKYDSQGDLKWDSIDTIASGISKSSITIDSDYNIYIAVRGQNTGNTTYSSTTIKYNSIGVKMWQKKNNGNFLGGATNPVDIKFHNSGNIYVLSSAENNITGYTDYNVVKYDTVGNQIWTYSHSFTNYFDIPKAFALDNAGNVYVTGNIYPTGGSYDSIATIKISNTGIFKWKKIYSSGFSNLDEATSIAIDISENIYVVGKSPDSSFDHNFLTIKYDTLGNQIWLAKYKNTINSHDIPNSICIDNSGNLYLSGNTSETNSTGILTIKYTNNVGVNEDLTNIGVNYQLSPNPFSTSFEIVCSKVLDDATLYLFDISGKIILEIENMNENQISIQRNNLKNGIYFFKIIENNITLANGKIVAN